MNYIYLVENTSSRVIKQTELIQILGEGYVDYADN